MISHRPLKRARSNPSPDASSSSSVLCRKCRVPMSNLSALQRKYQEPIVRSRLVNSHSLSVPTTCPACSTRQTPPPLGLDLRCRSRSMPIQKCQLNVVEPKPQADEPVVSVPVEQIDDANISSHSLSPSFLGQSTPCQNTPLLKSISSSHLQMLFVPSHVGQVGSPIESPLSSRCNRSDIVGGRLFGEEHGAQVVAAMSALPTQAGAVCTMTPMLGSTSLTTSSVNPSTFHAQSAGVGFLSGENGKDISNNVAPKPSAAQFLDCGHSDVTSESGTDSIAWNIDGDNDVKSEVNGVEKIDLDMLDGPEIVGNCLSNNVNVADSNLFPEVSPDCGGIDDLLLPGVMDVPLTISDDAADMPMSLLDGFLQSF